MTHLKKEPRSKLCKVWQCLSTAFYIDRQQSAQSVRCLRLTLLYLRERELGFVAVAAKSWRRSIIQYHWVCRQSDQPPGAKNIKELSFVRTLRSTLHTPCCMLYAVCCMWFLCSGVNHERTIDYVARGGVVTNRHGPTYFNLFV
jgi:hypothetical protein